jgi:hypothetical protein
VDQVKAWPAWCGWPTGSRGQAWLCRHPLSAAWIAAQEVAGAPLWVLELLGAHIHEVRRRGKIGGAEPVRPVKHVHGSQHSTDAPGLLSRPIQRSLTRRRIVQSYDDLVPHPAPPQRRAASSTPPTMVARSYPHNRPWSSSARTFVPRSRHRPRRQMFFSPESISGASDVRLRDFGLFHVALSPCRIGMWDQ